MRSQAREVFKARPRASGVEGPAAEQAFQRYFRASLEVTGSKLDYPIEVRMYTSHSCNVIMPFTSSFHFPIQSFSALPLRQRDQ